MSPTKTPHRFQRALGLLQRVWGGVLDFCLVLWVARAPVAVFGLGVLILWGAPQAQDLLIPLVDSRYYRIGLFFPVVFVLWAMPTHYAARLAVDDDERLDRHGRQANSPFLDFLTCQGPRLLGAATFLALLGCAYRARLDFPSVLGEDENVRNTIFAELNWFMLWCAVWAVLFWLYAAKREPLIARSPIGLHAEARAAKAVAPILDRLEIAPARSATLTRGGASYLGRTILLGYFIAFVAVMLASPFFIAEWLPRAWTVALVLGGWLPVLAYLSIIGRRLRAPLIVGMFAALSVLVLIVGDNHAVRLRDADAAGNTRIGLDQALDTWMKANGCSAATAASCPRPFIVVAAGGASRAGFFTASVIGQLLDKAPAHGLNAAEMRNRLFAISSVSGGSVGAVMSVAALARGHKEAQQPCPGGGDRFPLWYGAEAKNWRGCLEALMSGDFLTPTFIGLSFHDMIGLKSWRDRATLLEQSWEQYVETATANDASSGDCPFDRFDLECPFLALRGNDTFWLPLLILNGTSVSNGQRIVTTSLAPTYKPLAGRRCPVDAGGGDCRIFAETYHFHDLINPGGSGAMTADVRLSTAASNSARFPVVSPPGVIVPAKQAPVDRIVDGGYLENFGVLSAFDLVNAIHVLQPNLKPFVLVISNDPNMAVDPQAPPTNVKDTDFATDITGFVSGIATTRGARASIGVVHLQTLVDRQNSTCHSSLAHIRVWPIARSDGRGCQGTDASAVISMSWWLSKPVQLRLVAELDRRSCNADGFTDVWTALSSNGGCASP